MKVINFVLDLTLSQEQGCPTCRIVARSCDRRVKMCDKRFSSMTPFSDSLKKITEVSQNFRCRETKTAHSSPDGPLLINTPSLSKHRFMPSGQLPVVN